jgi:hypothetical protein
MDPESYIQPAAAWGMSMKVVLIEAGGVFNAAFAVFHLFFYRIFNWQEDLRTLTFVNRGIVRVLNLCLAMVFVIFAYVSLVHTDELLTSALGSGLMAAIALFWLARALLQAGVFRLRRWSSWWFFLVFLLGAALYGVPAALTAWPGAATP